MILFCVRLIFMSVGLDKLICWCELDGGVVLVACSVYRRWVSHSCTGLTACWEKLAKLGNFIRMGEAGEKHNMSTANLEDLPDSFKNM